MSTGDGTTRSLLSGEGEWSSDSEGAGAPGADTFDRSLDGRGSDPEWIGPYRVVRQLGSGGMGVVYLARREGDENVRNVAIKVASDARLESSGTNRLLVERKVLYGLNHPNIARIFDEGKTEDGKPYFVMEYIEGRPIDEYCDTNRLDTRERIKLFLKVCDAVEYCHANTIVHRDIKPSNVIVTRDGTPKLLDFGIAKLLNPDLMPAGEPTVEFRGPMTIAYASPEQASGGLITCATDVYSLGSLLYRLLTGHLPYQLPARRQAVVDIICNSEPDPPSTAIRRPTERVDPTTGTKTTITPERLASLRSDGPLQLRRRLSGDLDDILLVALAKKPSLRYASALEFKRDLENHLASRAVDARRRRRSVNWRAYSAQRFALRHRVALAAVGAAAASLLIGLGVSLHQRGIAIEERDRAAAYAASLEALSGGVVGSYVDVVSRLPGSGEMQRELLATAIAELESLDDRGVLDPRGRLALARRYVDLGDIACAARRSGPGDLEQADELFDRAIAALDGVPGEFEDETSVVRSLALSGKGDVLRERGLHEASVEVFQRAIDSLPRDGDVGGLDASAARVRALIGLAYGAANASVPDFESAKRRADEAYRAALAVERGGGGRDAYELVASSAHAYAAVGQEEAKRGALTLDATAAARLAGSIATWGRILERSPWDAETRGAVAAAQIRWLEGLAIGNVSNEDLGGVTAEELLASAWDHIDLLDRADRSDAETWARLAALVKVEDDLFHAGRLAVGPGDADASVAARRLDRLMAGLERLEDGLALMPTERSATQERFLIDVQHRIAECASWMLGRGLSGGDWSVAELSTARHRATLDGLVLLRAALRSDRDPGVADAGRAREFGGFVEDWMGLGVEILFEKCPEGLGGADVRGCERLKREIRREFLEVLALAESQRAVMPAFVQEQLESYIDIVSNDGQFQWAGGL